MSLSTLLRNRPVYAIHDCLEQRSSDNEASSSSVKLSSTPVISPDPLVWKTANCRTVDNVLTQFECDAIIERSEEAGFEPALLNIGYGREIYAPEKRDSDRVIVDDKDFAAELYERLKDFLPHNSGSTGCYKATSLNERMRILRYKPGHVFAAHSDGAYERPDGSERSRCSVMIYLNGGFRGGSTLFLSEDEKESTSVVPKAGRVLVFDHRLLHEGEKVTEGVKYAIRTDLMFERVRMTPSKKMAKKHCG
jgi:hypothetical protein